MFCRLFAVCTPFFQTFSGGKANFGELFRVCEQIWVNICVFTINYLKTVFSLQANFCKLVAMSISIISQIYPFGQTLRKICWIFCQILLLLALFRQICVFCRVRKHKIVHFVRHVIAAIYAFCRYVSTKSCILLGTLLRNCG